MLRNALISSYGTANSLRITLSSTTEEFTHSIGRLEIMINNEWGTVCSENFGLASANVACRQLGYDEAVSWGDADFLK